MDAREEYEPDGSEMDSILTVSVRGCPRQRPANWKAN